MSDPQRRPPAQTGARIDAPFYSDDSTDSGVSVFAIVNVLLRHPRLVIMMPIVAFLAAMLLEIGRSRVEYVAESTFTPQTGSALAAAATTPWIGSGTMQTSGIALQFYETLLRSRELRRRAGRDPYRFAKEAGSRDTLSGTLSKLYGGETSEGVLSSRVATDVQTGPGMVRLRTTARWPGLAVAINRRMLDLVNEFNIERRQAQAANEARFIESRLYDARLQLDRAEGDLQRFLEQNRNYASSPQLSFARGRLQRRVDLRQEIYLSLARAYETSRIEEMKNLPVITVIEPPEFVGETTASRPLFSGIIALVAALIVGIALAYFLEFLARQPSQDPAEFKRFQELSRTLVSGLTPRRALRGGTYSGRGTNQP